MRVTLAILALTAIAFPATAQVREVRLDEAVQSTTLSRSIL